MNNQIILPPQEFIKNHLRQRWLERLQKRIRIFLIGFLIFLFTLQATGGFLFLSYSTNATEGRDYSSNAVIYGGVQSLSELATKINSGSDGRNNDIRNIFLTLGIYPQEFNGDIDGAQRQTLDGYVTYDGRVILSNGQTVASSNVIVSGRSYTQGSAADVFGLPLWWRHPSNSFKSDRLSAFIHLVNGHFSWAVLKYDGSPVKTWGTPSIYLEKYVRNVTRNTSWIKGTIKAKRGEEIEFLNVYSVGPESLNNVWFYDALMGAIGNGETSNREYLSDPTNINPSAWCHYYPEGTTTGNGYFNKRMLVWYAPGRAPMAYGSASYRVQIKSNTPAGTIIKNDSAIYADRVGTVLSNVVNIEIEESVDYWQISTPSNQIAGQPFNITVTPKNSDGSTIATYNWGTYSNRPTFSGLNNSPSGQSPSYVFISSSGGVATYRVTTYAAQNNAQIIANGGASAEAQGASGSFNVNHANANRIEVSPPNFQTTAGSTVTYRTYAFDAYNNSWDVTPQSIFSILEPGHGGRWNNNLYTTYTAGQWTVQAVYNGFTNTTSLIVNHAEAINLFLSPDSATINAGDNIEYTAIATDPYNNSWDATSETTFAIESGAGGSWVGNRYISHNAGRWVVTGYYHSIVGITSLNVNPSTLEYFVFSSINNQIAGNPFNVLLSPYDEFGNLITNYNWENPINRPAFSGLSSSGGLSPEYLYQNSSGGIANYLITPYVAEENVRINAVLGSASGTSNQFDVLHAQAESITLSPDPWTVSAGQSVTYTAIATDPYGNSWDATSETTFAIESGAGGSWQDNIYTSERAGTWTVTGTYNQNPAIFDTASLTVEPGPAAYLTVTDINNPFLAGTSSNLTVTAYDQYDNQAINYSGTIHFTSTDHYPANLPSDYTFTPADSGSHTFTDGVTLYTAGNQTVTATDLSNPSVTGNQTVEVVPNICSQVVINPAPTATVIAGDPLQFSAEAFDQYGNLITDNESQFLWQGTGPEGLFQETVSGTYYVSASYQGIQSPETEVRVEPATLDSVIIDPDEVTLPVDGTQNYTVLAYDQYGNLITSGLTYDWSLTTGGTMNNNQIQSPLYTAGHLVGDFQAIVRVTQGSITRQDDAVIHIIAGPVNYFGFDPISSPQIAGLPFEITITAYDQYGNRDYNFTGTVELSDLTGTLNPTLTTNFVSGQWSGPVTITRALNNNQITATLSGGTETGTSNQFDVLHAQAESITLSPDPWTVSAGQSVTYTAIATDPYGNSWDATSETTFAIESGAGGSWQDNIYTSERAGTWTVTGTYNQNPAIFDTASLTVEPGPAAYLTVTDINNPFLAGTSSNLTVTAYDQYDNQAINYSGTIHFTSTDHYPANLPSDYTFTPADSGSHTFTDGVTLYTAGNQTVTATDLSNPSVTGNQTVEVVPNVLDRVIILPSTTPQIITAGETIEFSVFSYDQYGNSLSGVLYFWYNTGSGTNIFNQIQTGSYDVHVEGLLNGVVRYSNHVEVIVEPAALYRIIINPQTVTIYTDEDYQFRAFGYDQYNNLIPNLTFTWSKFSGVGSINQEGVYYSHEPGNAVVRATIDSIYGEAVVTVNSRPTPPTPPLPPAPAPSVLGTETAIAEIGSGVSVGPESQVKASESKKEAPHFGRIEEGRKITGTGGYPEEEINWWRHLGLMLIILGSIILLTSALILYFLPSKKDKKSNQESKN